MSQVKKIVVVGTSNSGKTSLIKKLCSLSSKSDISEFYTMSYDDKECILYDCCETDIYPDEADIVIIVYDATCEPYTQDSDVKTWVKSIMKRYFQVPVILVANKTDRSLWKYKTKKYESIETSVKDVKGI